MHNDALPRRHVDKKTAKRRIYTDVATIEGNLEVISVRKRPSFFIWEILTNQKIECFTTDKQLDEIVALLRHKPRIAVTGRVHYRNDIPRSIDVESIRVLRDVNELPQPKDIGPINITEGVSSEEHVRRLRS